MGSNRIHSYRQKSSANNPIQIHKKTASEKLIGVKIYRFYKIYKYCIIINISEIT